VLFAVAKIADRVAADRATGLKTPKRFPVVASSAKNVPSAAPNTSPPAVESTPAPVNEFKQ
jgi:hypothetical protein